MKVSKQVPGHQGERGTLGAVNQRTNQRLKLENGQQEQNLKQRNKQNAKHSHF